MNIIIKLLKINDKDKIFKATREERHVYGEQKMKERRILFGKSAYRMTEGKHLNVFELVF